MDLLVVSLRSPQQVRNKLSTFPSTMKLPETCCVMDFGHYKSVDGMGNCNQQKRVDMLVLFRSPTALCVVQQNEQIDSSGDLY